MVLTVDEKKYGRLLSRALPAVIRTEAENEKNLLLIESLMERGESRSVEEDRLLELLARLSEDFEAAHYDLGGATKPHEVLAFLMEKRGLRQVDLLPVPGCSNGTLSDMLSGRREISRGTVRSLGDFFKLPADLFI